jgi:hypothetical protein
MVGEFAVDEYNIHSSTEHTHEPVQWLCVHGGKLWPHAQPPPGAVHGQYRVHALQFGAHLVTTHQHTNAMSTPLPDALSNRAWATPVASRPNCTVSQILTFPQIALRTIASNDENVYFQL